MTPSTYQRVKAIFGDALDISTTDRVAFVRLRADGDAVVETEVLRLLDLEGKPLQALDGLGTHRQLLQSAASLHAFYAGEVLAGRFEVTRFLAQGGMGEVYEAEDLGEGERIALKTLRADIASQDHVAWLRREIQAARRISHPNVCKVHELVQTTTGDERPVVFLTMELLEGQTLSARLKDGGPMSERQALPLVRQMVAALTAAHAAGVVHRDFKPGNVMIVPRATGAPRVVVTDFGLARPEGRGAGTAASLTRSSAITVGTPAYMAPEQIEGKKAGPAADVYALGAVLYEMMTGELPYGEDSPLKMAVKKTREGPDSPRRLAPTLRSNWTRTILRCLEPDPAKRFQNVRDVLEGLETRGRSMVWLRRAIRSRVRILRDCGMAAALVGALWLGWWAWPTEAKGEALRVWQSGIAALHAGEPLLAAGRLDTAIAQHKLPALAHAQLAQAWLEAGFPARARTELGAATRRPLQSEADRRYTRSVEAQLAGQPQVALDLLKGRPGHLADLAHLEDLLGKLEARGHWTAVLQRYPQDAPALLRAAVWAAKAGDHEAAAQSYLAAETYFRGLQDEQMVQVVSARRGLTNLAAGHFEAARQDLPLLERLPLRPGLGYASCTRTITLMAGVDDHFAMPPDPVAFISQAFRAQWAFPTRDKIPQFDEPLRDRNFFVSFPIPRLFYCDGQLEARIRRATPLDADNDHLYAGMAGEQATMDDGSLWNNDRDLTEIIHVSSVFRPLKAVMEKSKESGGPFLDIGIGDDTTVDYIKLTLVY